MAATTTPDGIIYPVLSDQGDDIPAVLATLAGSVQTAITNLRNTINTHKGIPKGIATGTYIETPVALEVGQNVSRTITFPAGRFTAAPVVTATSHSGRMNIAIVSVSTTQAVLQIQNNSNGAGSSNNISWIAVQS